MTDDRARPDLDAEWEDLARFLAGESTPEQQRLVRDRLAQNEEQAKLVEALDAALTFPPDAPLPAAQVEAALAAVMARRGEPAIVGAAPQTDVIPLHPRSSAGFSIVHSRWRSAGLRAAAAVLVVAGASALWRATRTPEGATAGGIGTTSAAQVYATALRGLDTVALADGSTVVLAPSSRLAVAGGYGSRSREMTLDGQGYFDVVHDDSRPFIVHTPTATLRDVGTTFTVQSDSSRGTRVAVTSGAVDVVAAGTHPGTPTVLHAGDRAEVTGERMSVERGVVSGDEERSWTSGVLAFRDAPLATVAAGLRRWYGLELVVVDSTIAVRRLTATFDRGSADDVGRVLAAVLGGSVRRSGDTLRIGAPVRAR